MKFTAFFLYESRTFGKFYLATCATGCTSIDITPWTNVWSIEGPQGSYWQQATVPLPSGTTYVHFKGYAEWEDDRLYGGMAIDDVALVLAFITDSPTPQPPPTSIPTGSPTSPLPTGSLSTGCDFDDSGENDGLCTFSNPFSDSDCTTPSPTCFRFTRLSGSTPTFGTGPSEDHTSGNGFYMVNTVTYFLNSSSSSPLACCN